LVTAKDISEELKSIKMGNGAFAYSAKVDRICTYG